PAGPHRGRNPFLVTQPDLLVRCEGVPEPPAGDPPHEGLVPSHALQRRVALARKVRQRLHRHGRRRLGGRRVRSLRPPRLQRHRARNRRGDQELDQERRLSPLALGATAPMYRFSMVRLYSLVVLLHAYIGWRLLPDLLASGTGLGSAAALATAGWLVLSACLMPQGLFARRTNLRAFSVGLVWAGAIAI